MSVLLIAAAVIPGLLVCWLVYLADRYEREPLLPLAGCFLLGALATVPAMQAESVLLPMIGEVGHDPVLTGLMAFGAVAPVEELAKWLCLILGAFLWRFFNEPFDGFVYAVMVAMGFATVENLFYADLYGPETALLRAFTAVPAHLVFAIAMGYYVGLAKFDPPNRIHLLLRGLLVSLLLHGAYDFLVMQNWTKWLASLGAFGIYLGLYYFGKLLREHLNNSPFRPQEEGAV